MNVNFNKFIFFKNIILISLICFIYMLYLLHGITSKEMPKMPRAQTIAPNSTPWQLPCLRRIFLRGMLLWLSGSMRSWWSSGESEWPWWDLLWGRLLSTIPERGFFLPKNIIHLICYLFISGSLFHLLLFRLLLFTIIKKGKTRTCPPLFQFYWKTLISLFYIFINIYLPYDTLPSLDGT